MSKLYTSIILIATALFFMSNSGGRGSIGNEAVTDAPGESGRTCGSSGCHDDSQFAPSVSFEILAPADGSSVDMYKAGRNYTARVSIAASGSPGGYGFQMVALNGSGESVGEWIASNQTQTLTLNDRSYIEHSGVIAEPEFEFNWTSPSDDEGDVTFYISANAVNGTGSQGGDGSTNNSFVFPFDPTLSIGSETIEPVAFYPNPAVDRLNIENNTFNDFGIYNAQGKLVLSGNIEFGQIDVSSLIEGVYFMQLEQGKQIERFIKL